MGKHPNCHLVYGENGPMALVRGTTAQELCDHLANFLDENRQYNPLHHHEWDAIRVHWIRANPCSPTACDETHTTHYVEVNKQQRGAFQGAFVDLT